MHDIIIFQNYLTETQVEQLLQLYKNEWWTNQRTIIEIKKMLSGPNLIFAYVDAEDKLVGFARVLTDGVFKAFLFDIIAQKELRGIGFGKRIIKDIISHPEVRQVKHIELYCLPELNGFYEQFGFSVDVGGINLMRKENFR